MRSGRWNRAPGWRYDERNPSFRMDDLLIDFSKERIDRAVLAAHRTFPGGRPSMTILHGRLDPRSLGRLVALCEHKVFTRGVIWDVNSFDQWGVELGKQLALPLIAALTGHVDGPSDMDSSTAGLLAALNERGFSVSD